MLNLPPLSLFGHPSLDLQSTLTQSELKIPNLITSTKTLFPNQGPIHRFRGSGLGHIFWGDPVQPTTSTSTSSSASVLRSNHTFHSPLTILGSRLGTGYAERMDPLARAGLAPQDLVRNPGLGGGLRVGVPRASGQVAQERSSGSLLPRSWASSSSPLPASCTSPCRGLQTAWRLLCPASPQPPTTPRTFRKPPQPSRSRATSDGPPTCPGARACHGMSQEHCLISPRKG